MRDLPPVGVNVTFSDPPVRPDGLRESVWRSRRAFRADRRIEKRSVPAPDDVPVALESVTVLRPIGALTDAVARPAPGTLIVTVARRVLALYVSRPLDANVKNDDGSAAGGGGGAAGGVAAGGGGAAGGALPEAVRPAAAVVVLAAAGAAAAGQARPPARCT